MADKEVIQSSIPEEEISLKELILNLQAWVKYLCGKWLIILLVGLFGGAIGLFMSINSKPTYIAKLNFVLEDAKSGGLGNLGGLAAMAGVNLGTSGGGLFQGDNILELYKSRHMLTETLLSLVDEQGKELLVDRYIAMNELREAWSGSDLADVNFDLPRAKFTLQHDSLMGLLVKNIRENILNVRKPHKTLSLIEVEVKAPDEVFAKVFTETLVSKVSAFYVDGRTQKSQENLNILQHQADSVRRELNRAIGGVAASADANPNANPARQVLRVGSAQRQVDVQANQAILTELVKNLELAKVTLRKDAPLIQVVDSPILPLEQERLGKAKAVVLGGLIAGFLIVAFLVGRKYYQDIMSS
ncbi:lipopolysaccharide biosynthesis protein [Sphingobacterium sp. UT-1RO-CII-1]|uniref:lipopolysaccharide biosynthesis protein n=1 Tax=Sphingobacterium sp. UT-1RO-CII-1 TaxID=2995225 RepID=UPI00227B76A9|nr:lipopolysaccharide biosynthesis protein [Sphingobacterium sp. UT-1RO-CII-1]MCY4780808.1 lipopolysaccharide biosynthesis protein [Sphingobacterium sp. UT-1RO-CII-1]